MSPRALPLFLLVSLLAFPLAAQDVRVRSVRQVAMPASPDCNSPAFWRDGRLFWYGSHGSPWLSVGPDQFGPWETQSAFVPSPDNSPKWMEAVWPESSGVLWGWYHAEPVNLFPDSTLTAPKIGAAVSVDGGYTMQDLGFVLESGEPLDAGARNGYFAGGHGDPSVILDRAQRYFYIFFGHYGGPLAGQGVCVARMAIDDRGQPVGKVWKYHNGAWQEPGLGGRVTPIFAARKAWGAADPDAFWGPAVHWNTYLNCYVMLMNRASGGGWSEEGVYVSFNPDLSRPELWTTPRRILARGVDFEDPGDYYAQVMGLGAGDTDRRAGQTARLYLHGTSKWEIDFIAPQTAPTALAVLASPFSGSINAGEPATLSVTAMGQPPFTYQWFKDGAPLAGATDASYTIASAALTDAGNYAVVVSNTFGGATSSTVALAVKALDVPPTEPPPPPPPPPEAFLSNLSVRGQLSADRPELTVGFVVRGAAAKPLVLRAIGPTLGLFGIENTAADPRLEVFDASALRMAENDNWLAADAAAFAGVGAFGLPTGSADAALVVPVPGGASTARVSASGPGIVLAEIYDPAPTSAAKLVNLSARARIGIGWRTLVAGFTLSGSGEKRVLIRGLGPQLAIFGITDAAANPVLAVFDAAGAQLAENAGWDAALEPAFGQAGAMGLTAGSRDAAVVLRLAAGQSYTASLRTADGTRGEALLEIYELP